MLSQAFVVFLAGLAVVAAALATEPKPTGTISGTAGHGSASGTLSGSAITSVGMAFQFEDKIRMIDAAQEEVVMAASTLPALRAS
jgi:hypothetical protein